MGKVFGIHWNVARDDTKVAQDNLRPLKVLRRQGQWKTMVCLVNEEVCCCVTAKANALPISDAALRYFGDCTHLPRDISRVETLDGSVMYLWDWSLDRGFDLGTCLKGIGRFFLDVTRSVLYQLVHAISREWMGLAPRNLFHFLPEDFIIHRSRHVEVCLLALWKSLVESPPGDWGPRTFPIEYCSPELLPRKIIPGGFVQAIELHH